MAIKIFGWEIRKYRPEKQFTSDDRLASFILMAMTEKVNRLFTPHGFTVQVTDEERKQYVLDGKVPYRIAVAASEFRRQFISRMHRLLLDDSSEHISALQEAGFQAYAPALDTDLLGRIMQATEGWEQSPQGIPYFCLFDYLPVNRDEGIEPDSAAVRTRKLVWNFKYNTERVSPRMHVNALYDAVIPLAAKLNESFEGMTEKMTFFCVPASDEDNHWMRYREFSRMLCRLTGMTDSFKYVHINSGKTPAHLGGERKVNYSLDNGWFRDRVVVVFDDILTTGGSLGRCADELRKAGAVVMAACFLGRTVKKE